MATEAKVEVKLDYKAILRIQTTTSHKLASNAANAVQARARRFAPKRTGLLAASIGVDLERVGVVTTYRIGSPLSYAGYQEWGTGPIFARPGGVLVFRGRAGELVFTRHTSGVPATHFMLRAAERLSILDFV